MKSSKCKWHLLNGSGRSSHWNYKKNAAELTSCQENSICDLKIMEKLSDWIDWMIIKSRETPLLCQFYANDPCNWNWWSANKWPIKVSVVIHFGISIINHISISNWMKELEKNLEIPSVCVIRFYKNFNMLTTLVRRKIFQKHR